jgi:hypothetical protein
VEGVADDAKGKQALTGGHCALYVKLVLWSWQIGAGFALRDTAMGQFPLSLIPTFFVPLLLIFHLIALSRAGVGWWLVHLPASLGVRR